MHALPDSTAAPCEVSSKRSTQFFLAWAFGLAPVFLILITWSPGGQPWWIKTYALPVAAVELMVVATALVKGLRIRLTRPVAALLALLMVAWITAFRAPDIGEAVLMTDFWTLHVLFGFAVARLFESESFVWAILTGFVASMFALAIFAINAPSDLDWIGELPGLGNPRAFAIYAAVAIGLAVAVAARGNIWASGIMVVAFSFIFWSGSRGPLLATSGALAASACLAPALRTPKVWGAFVASAVTGFLIATIIGSPAALFGVARMTDTGDNGRVGIWRTTIDLISRRPIFGYGEGQTQYFVHVPWTMHPHNIVLQILLAWGVAGLGIILGLSWWVVRNLRGRLDNDNLPLVVGALVLLFYSMIDGAIYNVHTAALFAALLGLMLAPKRNIRAQA